MDDLDEFDDEETFLNLDDVLQGAASPECISRQSADRSSGATFLQQTCHCSRCNPVKFRQTALAGAPDGRHTCDEMVLLQRALA